MIALGEIESSPPPREALAQRRAAALEPWWKWALFALAWAWVATVPAGIVIGVGILASLPFVDKLPVPPWYAETIVIAGGVAFAAMWIPFAKRVRRRRAIARTLIAHGALIHASIAGVRQYRYKGAKLRDVSLAFEHDGRRHGVLVRWLDARAPEPGGSVPVLFEPGAPYVIVFGLKPRPIRRRLNR